MFEQCKVIIIFSWHFDLSSYQLLSNAFDCPYCIWGFSDWRSFRVCSHVKNACEPMRVYQCFDSDCYEDQSRLSFYWSSWTVAFILQVSRVATIAWGKLVYRQIRFHYRFNWIFLFIALRNCLIICGGLLDFDVNQIPDVKLNKASRKWGE